MDRIYIITGSLRSGTVLVPDLRAERGLDGQLAADDPCPKGIIDDGLPIGDRPCIYELDEMRMRHP